MPTAFHISSEHASCVNKAKRVPVDTVPFLLGGNQVSALSG